MKVLEKLGIKSIKEFDNQDEWYIYLIDEYIPDQGHNDMLTFMSLGFSPINYIIWKATKEDLFSEELEKKILKQFEKLKVGGE